MLNLAARCVRRVRGENRLDAASALDSVLLFLKQAGNSVNKQRAVEIITSALAEYSDSPLARPTREGVNELLDGAIAQGKRAQRELADMRARMLRGGI
jgi:hypothetical protein